MKKIIIISSAILVLGLGLVLKRQHHEFKESNKKAEETIQKCIDFDQYAINAYSSTKNLTSLEKDLVEGYKYNVKLGEKIIKTSIDNQNISFISYIFTVTPKQILNYFK